MTEKTLVSREPWWAEPPKPGQRETDLEWGYLEIYSDGSFFLTASDRPMKKLRPARVVAYKAEFCFLALFALLMTCNVSAEVYKSVAQSGRIHYSEKSIAALYKRYTTKNPGQRKKKLNRSPNQFNSLIEAAAQRYGVDERLIHAVIRAESGYRPDAVSPKGAVGLMQLMPPTAKRFGVKDSYDPKENIAGGTQYLSTLLALFQSDVKLAVAAYNAGENNILKYGKQIPPFIETKVYVTRVMRFYRNSF